MSKEVKDKYRPHPGAQTEFMNSAAKRDCSIFLGGSGVDYAEKDVRDRSVNFAVELPWTGGDRNGKAEEDNSS